MLNFRGLIFATAVGAILFVGATSFMSPTVYSSWWWMAFWAAVTIGLCISIVRNRLWRRPAVFALHASFLLMLAGGGATAMTAKRGTIHLVPGSEVSVFTDENGSTTPLPTGITLEKFEAEYYPGMCIPRDFHSFLETADGRKLHISMNHIGRIDGWRLYQTSFDGSGGSVLTAYRDPVGIALTYAGYLLFAISGLWLLLGKRRGGLALLAVLSVSVSASAAAPAISREHADSLDGRQVVFRGRIVPFATMASELTCKLTGRTTVGQLDACRFVASLTIFGREWREVPFIKIKSTGLRAALSCQGGYVSVASLYDKDGNYLPEKLFEDGKGPLDNDILRLDEKVALLSELWSGELFSPLTPDASERLTETEVESQLLYTRLQPVRLFFILALVSGIATLMLIAFHRDLRTGYAGWALAIVGFAIFIWQWTILGHIPLADSAGILFFVATVLCAMSAIASGRSPLASALGLLMGGFAALVAWLSLKDPSMTPLMPVLASPWLAVHVSLVMAAYAVLAFTMPVAVAALASPSKRRELTALSIKFIAPGVYLLGLGIFIGAMWANVSWGRYWAWDPKETWALVTMLLYACPLHSSLGLAKRPALFHSFLIFAFFSIIMTYAGVNYLPSLHAYK